MKLERGRLSQGECVAMVITCIAAFFIVTFGPNLYLSVTGQVRENNAQIVPKHGTIEYEQFRQNFQSEYGREWTVQDDLNAMENGAHVMIGIITSIMAACVLFSMVHDLRCWRQEKRMYQSRQTMEPPMCAKTQWIRILIYLSLALPCACYMWIIVPRVVIPLN